MDDSPIRKNKVVPFMPPDDEASETFFSLGGMMISMFGIKMRVRWVC
ncbi:MAG: hypothetical protein EZS28_052131, partial [Streblomastix strix]